MNRRVRACTLAVAVATVLTGVVAARAGRVAAAPAGEDAVVAFAVEGVGNGHGRGLSQWGSYGRALAGQDYRQILNTYYGGTQVGSRSGATVRVRLTGWDNASTVGVISEPGAAIWNGVAYRSLMAVATGTNTFNVFGSTTDLGCPSQANLVVPHTYMSEGASGPEVSQMQRVLSALGHDPGGIDGSFGPMTKQAVLSFQQAEALPATGAWDQPTWTRAQERVAALGGGAIAWAQVGTNVAGPLVFATSVGAGVPAADVLGLCKGDASVVHYRGTIEVHHTGDGHRVVNAVGIDSYLRGVVPRESPAYWGDGGAGAGMQALRAQSVAARSYALTQSRYSYAGTCDTSSCQVYGGAATRQSATSGGRPLETANTDQAIADTAGEVRVWPADGSVVSTEFSASNGPRTAGGAFPPIDDPWDDHPDNPLHRWRRIIDVDSLASTYGLSRADAIRTVQDGASKFDGIWANHVTLGDGRTVSAWDFRNAFNLPAPGFVLVPITRTVASAATFAYIGDSVGVGIAGTDTSPLRVLLEGVHGAQMWDSVGGRPTGAGTDDGADAAARVPEGTDLAVVELGYNDSPSQMATRIDAVMQTLRTRRVERVLWVTVSERRTTTDYATTNQAIRAAESRWPELDVLDWEDASDEPTAGRWFTDGVHLTSTGNAEFSLFLRQHILGSTARPVAAESVYRVPVLGLGGVPAGANAGQAGVGGVALNVTAVNPEGPGWLRVWDCAAAEPNTSSVNFTAAGAVEPNAVVVPLAPESHEVCVRAKVRSHVIVDVAGYFPAAAAILKSAAGRVIDTRESVRVPAGGVLPVRVLGVAGVPDGATAGEAGVAGVALNVTAVHTNGPGWLRVWDCAAGEPDTSSVNFMAAGAVEPNAVVVPLAAGSAGEVCVRALVETDILVDLAGWFVAGVRPAAGRVIDTRLTEPVAAQAVLRVPVLGAAGVPGAATAGEAGVAGVALNVTAVDTSGPGWLRVWDCAAPEPDTSSVNYMRAGIAEPNAVIVPFAAGSPGEVCVKTRVGTNVIVDVAGWFDTGVAPAAGRIADTRYGIGPLPT